MRYIFCAACMLGGAGLLGVGWVIDDLGPLIPGGALLGTGWSYAMFGSDRGVQR